MFNKKAIALIYASLLSIGSHAQTVSEQIKNELETTTHKSILVDRSNLKEITETIKPDIQNEIYSVDIKEYEKELKSLIKAFSPFVKMLNPEAFVKYGDLILTDNKLFIDDIVFGINEQEFGAKIDALILSTSNIKDLLLYKSNLMPNFRLMIKDLVVKTPKEHNLFNDNQFKLSMYYNIKNDINTKQDLNLKIDDFLKITTSLQLEDTKESIELYKDAMIIKASPIHKLKLEKLKETLSIEQKKCNKIRHQCIFDSGNTKDCQEKAVICEEKVSINNLESKNELEKEMKYFLADSKFSSFTINVDLLKIKELKNKEDKTEYNKLKNEIIKKLEPKKAELEKLKTDIEEVNISKENKDAILDLYKLVNQTEIEKKGITDNITITIKSRNNNVNLFDIINLSMNEKDEDALIKKLDELLLINIKHQ